MERCPNKNRKTKHPGGGVPGCRGVLIIRINMPMEFAVKRLPRGGDTAKDLLNHRVRNHGAKVHPEKIMRRIDQQKYDVVCSECGWSLDRSIATLIAKRGLVRRKAS